MIRKRKLRDIMCDNIRIDELPLNIFDISSEKIKCSENNKINFITASKCLDCTADKSETKDCNTYCPVDGSWGTWTDWSSCSATCGGGSHRRTRQCDDPPPPDGGQCPGQAEEAGNCNTDPCSVMLVCNDKLKCNGVSS